MSGVRKKCLQKLSVAACLLLLAAPELRAQSPTTTTLTVSSNSVTAGTVVTLTAAVTAAGKPVAPGQVNFCNAAAVYCEGPALLGQAQLTVSGTASIKLVPGIGAHSIKAVLQGTMNAAGSSSGRETVTVTGVHATSTAISAAGTAGNYQLTAAVVGSSTQLPTGQVSFADSTNQLKLGAATLGPGTTSSSFTSLISPNAGNEPVALAIGDFNGDGKPDVAVVNTNTDTVTILLGNAAGAFTYSSTLPTGASPRAIAVGDFNDDGNLDLAVANINSNNVTLLFGDGKGGFVVSSSSPVTGTGPNSMAVGDFNGDGNADLAVTNQFSSTVTILLGDGHGNFTAGPQSPATGSFPYAVAAGDFNRDGNQDLAVANYYGSDVTVLLGNGKGDFTAAPSPGTGVYPDSVAVGDFNGDGKPDLAVANQFSATVTILLGDGNGGFAPPTASGYQPPVTGKMPDSVAVGDFNGDGVQDLAVANSNSNSVTILFGKGDGTFPTATAQTVSSGSGTAPYSLAVGDSNGDGRTDFGHGGFRQRRCNRPAQCRNDHCHSDARRHHVTRRQRAECGCGISGLCRLRRKHVGHGHPCRNARPHESRAGCRAGTDGGFGRNIPVDRDCVAGACRHPEPGRNCVLLQRLIPDGDCPVRESAGGLQHKFFHRGNRYFDDRESLG